MGGAFKEGYGAPYGVYSRPTYVHAERTGRPEAVVPLDKYTISDKDGGGGGGNTYNYYILAQDPKSFRDFARRNTAVFREMFSKGLEENDPRMRRAVKTAVR